MKTAIVLYLSGEREYLKQFIAWLESHSLTEKLEQLENGEAAVPDMIAAMIDWQEKAKVGK